MLNLEIMHVLCNIEEVLTCALNVQHIVPK